VTGQDGSYLSELLIQKGYEVHGLIRQVTQFQPDRWGYLKNVMTNPQFKVHYGDLTDSGGVRSLIDEVQPDEVYNLAAQSHVGHSFQHPENTTDVTAMGAMRLLEAIRRGAKNCRFYQASSSEMFGKVTETPQNENTRFYPRSPYGCAKVYAHYLTQNYREAYGLFAVSGILFNHESERRGENFVTRKITRAVGRIKAGTQDKLYLGDTSTKRDWGYAPDYVEAMWRMMQQDTPEDFVIGTGVTHSVNEFITAAFETAGLDPQKHVDIDTSLFRPSEVDYLRADPNKAQRILGWTPSVDFDGLVQRMVKHDIALAEKEKALL
jgi:GDPmannose 4,6-dehydratase